MLGCFERLRGIDLASVPHTSDGARETHAVSKEGPSATELGPGIVPLAFPVVRRLFSCVAYII